MANTITYYDYVDRPTSDYTRLGRGNFRLNIGYGISNNQPFTYSVDNGNTWYKIYLTSYHVHLDLWNVELCVDNSKSVTICRLPDEANPNSLNKILPID